ncbi:hypothetical protein B0H10DRAFT_1939451 [Mycena sp. CBHHK59/15]|nr:hypothetical protein B0H10DRAFT_1939451 [Mycena sp. CBHHK59/15]
MPVTSLTATISFYFSTSSQQLVGQKVSAPLNRPFAGGALLEQSPITEDALRTYQLLTPWVRRSRAIPIYRAEAKFKSKIGSVLNQAYVLVESLVDDPLVLLGTCRWQRKRGDFCDEDLNEL